MIDLLNSLFRALPLLGEMSLTAAYVAAVVAVLRLILKKRAPKQVLCLLWLVVFARLLIPVNLESPLSILPDQERVQAVQDLPTMLIGGGQAAPAQVPAQGQGQTGGVTADPVVQSNPGPVPTAPRPESAAFPWRALLAGVWLAGALAMGLYGLGSYLSLKRRLFDAIRSQDGAWEHPAVGSPFILGVIRPRIYLPAGLCGQPRQFILCHERAHLRRLDHIVKPVCWAALAIHWFNPAVWAAFILMSRDIEAACDEAVIRRLGPKVKADYSATLLALATGGRMPAPCPLAFDEGNAKGRIQNVLRYRRPALWIVVVSVVMAVMAAVCLLTDPVSAKEPGPDPDASESQSGDSLLDPWMEEILAGRQNFTSADTGENVNIGLLNGAYPGEFTVTLSKFAVVDLDRDGVSEMVLWPSIDGDNSEERISTLGYLILRRIGDEVYSYSPSYRSFFNLKSDGTFFWNGGSDHYGVGSIRFTQNGFSIDEHTRSEGELGEEQVYYVDGLKATSEEFNDVWAQHHAKPDPIWYVFEDGVLKYAPINVPIPLDEYAQAAPVPDFLDEDQQLLYRQMYMMYTRLFGATSEYADSWPGHYVSHSGIEPVDYNGTRYLPAVGLYANWSDFEQAVLSVFTQDFWKSKNEQATYTTYVNIDGTMHYLDWARGSYGYNENFPETFRLVSQTDDAIEFIMTGYYSEPYPAEGESSEDRDARLKAGWEYSIEFPMRMVRTERGWRFDEFHSAHTDNGVAPFSNRLIPNPDAPPLPTPPEPSATPEPVVISELDGMRLLSTADGYRLAWQEQTFPVGPDISYGDRPWLEDFDEDGQPEALFPGRADGSYPFTIYDFVDNALLGYPCPDITATVYPAVSAGSVAAYSPATGGLTMTFPWGEGDGRRYITLHTTLPSGFFAGCEELADGRPLRMSVTPGSINGVLAPRGLSYRARVMLTDGTTTSPEVGYLWFGIQYSDRGFEVRTPEESDFGTDFSA